MNVHWKKYHFDVKERLFKVATLAPARVANVVHKAALSDEPVVGSKEKKKRRRMSGDKIKKNKI